MSNTFYKLRYIKQILATPSIIIMFIQVLELGITRPDEVFFFLKNISKYPF